MLVLIVEDDLGLIELFSDKIKEMGFESVAVNLAQEAYDFIENNNIDLIVLDYALPDFSAKELLVKLRENDIPIPPFIITTGQGDERVAVEMMKLGARDYLVKDINLFEFFQEIIKRVDREISNEKQIKLSQISLKESMLNFKELIDHATDGFLLMNETGQVVEWNAALEKITGINKKNALGKKVWEIQYSLVAPEEKKEKIYKRLESDIQKFLKKGEAKFLNKKSIVKIFNRDQMTIAEQEAYSIKSEKGYKLGVILRDVTAEKENEERLLKNQYYLTKAQEIGKIGTWELDLVNDVLIWTEENYKIFGVPVGTPLNYDFFINCVHPEDRDYVNKKWEEQAVSLKQPYEIVHRIVVNGSVKWVREKAEIEYSKAGDPLKAIGFTQDVTDIVKIEESLKKSRESFDLAMQATNDGVFDWNLETNEIYYAPAWKSMLGYKDDELENKFSVWEELTDEQDVKKSWAILEAHLKGELPRFECEFKMKHKAGHWVDILSRANAVFDENNKPVRMVGTHVDISERKKVEQQLEKNLKEKTILLQEVHHRVKNNLQIIISIIQMQFRKVDENFKPILKDIQDRARAMAMVHEKLYESDNLASINIKKYLTDLTQKIMFSFKSTQKIEIKIDVDNITVNIETAIPIGLLINELVTNSIKHAFSSEEFKRKNVLPTIGVSFNELKNGKYRLCESDNGSGMSPQKIEHIESTMGLRLIKLWAEGQLGGRLNIGTSCELGTCFEVEFGINSKAN